KLLQWCDEAAVTHWLQDSLEPPSWQEVHRRLQHEGRTSKVDHPSVGQLRFAIPPPKTARQVTLKGGNALRLVMRSSNLGLHSGKDGAIAHLMAPKLSVVVPAPWHGFVIC